MSDLHYLTAAEALRLFRARELSPVELVSAVIKRAEAVEPVINAFAETFYEQALDQARAVYEYMKRKYPNLPGAQYNFRGYAATAAGAPTPEVTRMKGRRVE